MIDEDVLRGLPGRVASGSGTPAAEIVRRGSRARRRRQVARGLGAATIVVGLAGAALAQLPKERDLSAASQPGPKTMAESCGGHTDKRGPEAADGIRLLPDWLPDGAKITYASARVDLRSAENCPRVPTSLVVVSTASAPGSPPGVAVLEGPSPERYRPPNMTYNQSVEMRGTQGTLVQYPLHNDSPSDPDLGPPYASQLRLLWTEGDGSSWDLTSNHLTPEELVDLANRLVLDSVSETPATLPDPGLFVVGWQRTARAAPFPEEVPWWIAYTGTGNIESGDYMIDVRMVDPTGPGPEARLAGAEHVTVHGRQGVVVSEGPTASLVLWRESPGVEVDVSGPSNLTNLLRVADSLRLVPSDDERIRD